MVMRSRQRSELALALARVRARVRARGMRRKGAEGAYLLAGGKG